MRQIFNIRDVNLLDIALRDDIIPYVDHIDSLNSSNPYMSINYIYLNISIKNKYLDVFKDLVTNLNDRYSNILKTGIIRYTLNEFNDKALLKIQVYLDSGFTYIYVISKLKDIEYLSIKNKHLPGDIIERNVDDNCYIQIVRSVFIWYINNIRVFEIKYDEYTEKLEHSKCGISEKDNVIINNREIIIDKILE